jgi:hypothetical protein
MYIIDDLLDRYCKQRHSHHLKDKVQRRLNQMKVNDGLVTHLYRVTSQLTSD